ncbi:hypothetical protein ACQUW5_14975 [Legionella sp. CNM-1927-20]|uniref:hypothetical protein n=1 Tax=Legionella sp. CNM-1927-20 TaxID=3422221 RepID=UPI00403B2011
MKSSIFQRQLPDGKLHHDTHRDIAKVHMADPPSWAPCPFTTIIRRCIWDYRWTFRQFIKATPNLMGFRDGFIVTVTQKDNCFSLGNNTGSISFCAMDMATGDCVVSFANSMNGPSVFQQVAEPIIGDIKRLSKYCGFNDVSPHPQSTRRYCHNNSFNSLISTGSVDNGIEITNQFKQSMNQL